MGERRSMAFAIKAEICDPQAKTFALSAQKTMYGGKHIAEGDIVFVFASENEGGCGLIARGVVTSAEAIAKKRGIIRQAPRVTANPRPSSISNSIARQRTRSSASRTRRRRFSANFSSPSGD
jgi:hypothetical protein